MTLSSVDEVFRRMPEVFSPTAAQGLDAVFQFDIKGEGGGAWNVTIRDGACAVEQGTHDDPRVTISMSDENWISLVNRQLNAVTAFMTGKIKVKGDLMLAQRIGDLFPF